MSRTIFLRFPSESAFLALMPVEFVRDGETGDPLPAGVDAISIIDAIGEGGQWDGDGNVVVAPTLLPGYHVNALGTVPETWVAYVVTPTAPVRVFGGES